jgi:hypothetical protein
MILNFEERSFQAEREGIVVKYKFKKDEGRGIAGSNRRDSGGDSDLSRAYANQRGLQSPAFSRLPGTKLCIRVLAGSRNYYIKDLTKIRKRIPFVIHRFQPPYATALTL